MTIEVISYQSTTGRVVIRDRIRFVSILTVILALTALLIMVSINYFVMASSIEKGAYLTNQQMVIGGKRFIDYFWSLNSRSVEEDQYTAARMFVLQQDYEKRIDYLVKSNFIKKVQEARIISEIDWKDSSYTIMDNLPEQPINSMRVEYKGYLVVNRSKTVPWHMILVLSPVEFTNDNPTGVGVVSYIDVAEAPIL